MFSTRMEKKGYLGACWGERDGNRIGKQRTYSAPRVGRTHEQREEELCLAVENHSREKNEADSCHEPPSLRAGGEEPKKKDGATVRARELLKGVKGRKARMGGRKRFPRGLRCRDLRGKNPFNGRVFLAKASVKSCLGEETHKRPELGRLWKEV